MSESHKGNPGYWLGKRHSQKSIEKMSKSVKGEKNHNFGQSKNEEVKLKMSLSQSNKKTVICNETKILYRSLGQASKELGICEQNIRSVVKGRRKSAGGLTFSYYEAQKCPN